MFTNQLGMAQRSASQIGQRNMSNIQANNRAGGGLLSGASGFLSNQQNNAMLSNSANQSGAFNSSLTSALSNRNFALQGMEGFNPLQTGSQTSQSKSGLGTWLPQVAGAALGAATGGLSGLAGSAMSAGYGAIQNAANTGNNPWSPTSPTVNSTIQPQSTASTWGF